MAETGTKRGTVLVGARGLEGLLRIPDRPKGLVIFAHGAGSSRQSPRNSHVADRLAERRIASLLFDLLTEEEAADRGNVFDIPLLGARLAEAVDWARAEPSLKALPIGLFGASTGAAAALTTAALMPEAVAAVVSRGGRPDLAGPALGHVRTPVLLIVGGADETVLYLNEKAARALHCEQQLSIVHGATHLFEEPGALDSVVDLAAGWFERHFAPAAAP